MGMIGNEGMLDVTLVLGIGVAPLLGVVQRSGSALRMTVAQLRLASITQPISICFDGTTVTDNCLHSIPRGRSTAGTLVADDA
jgi:hypothetical protein